MAALTGNVLKLSMLNSNQNVYAEGVSIVRRARSLTWNIETMRLAITENNIMGKSNDFRRKNSDILEPEEK